MATSSNTSSHLEPLRIRQLKPAGPPVRDARWWRRGILTAVAIAVMAIAFALLPGSKTSRPIDPTTLHTIQRGDLLVTITEQGTLESSNNTEIKCKVRGDNTITWVIEAGTNVQPGDELIRLDTLFIEEQISERTKYAHLARSAAARSKADVAAAELAISEYIKGRFVTELSEMQKNLTIANSNFLASKNILAYAKMMAESGYTTELEVEEREFGVSQADLQVQLSKTQIDVLTRFTKEEQLATLVGELKAAKAQYNADRERAYADEHRLQRAQEEFEQCVIRAKRSGMVIYPTGEDWKETPEIEEGATVHKDQVLLLMPDLTQMQVKVGVHESIVKRVQPGLYSIVKIPGKTLEGRVSYVSPVAEPAGWWTGSVVKYDTIVDLPPGTEGVKPGMSVDVGIILARHEDVVMVPINAVIETNKGFACWVATPTGPQRRALQLGDNNDMFILVESGLSAGEQVVLDPLAHVDEAQVEAAKTIDKTTRDPSASQTF